MSVKNKMAFVLRGEIEIDGRKGTAVLRGIQREAKATSRSFDQSGRSASSLAKSLLSINSQASATSKALQLIGRTGGLGLFGAGAVKGGIALGDALTRIAGEAEASGNKFEDGNFVPSDPEPGAATSGGLTTGFSVSPLRERSVSFCTCSLPPSVVLLTGSGKSFGLGWVIGTLWMRLVRFSYIVYFGVFFIML
jgi:hypothetical protein